LDLTAQYKEPAAALPGPDTGPGPREPRRWTSRG